MTQPNPGSLTSERLPSIGVLWLMLRLVLIVVVLTASAHRPATGLETTVAVWPPGPSAGQWLQRVLIEPWLRWDTEYYVKIATRGYRLDDGTAQFHPLFPWAGRGIGYVLGGNMGAGLLVVSSVCGLLFLYAFERLAQLDLPAAIARRASVFLLHAPLAFILFTPYTESMFLLCSVTALLMARRGSWWMAGVAGGLAVLTRQQGIFLLVPLAWEFWEWSGREWRNVAQHWPKAFSLGLIPAGLLFWVTFRAIALGDVAFELNRPRTWIYGLMISNTATRVVPEQEFVMPWRALQAALDHPRPTTRVDLILGSLFLLMLAAGARFLWRLRPSYLLYSGVIILVSFSYFTGYWQPYMGLPRHCFLAFPLFLPLAAWADRPKLIMAMLGIGLIGLMALAFFYSAHSLWVP